MGANAALSVITEVHIIATDTKRLKGNRKTTLNKSKQNNTKYHLSHPKCQVGNYATLIKLSQQRSKKYHKRKPHSSKILQNLGFHIARMDLAYIKYITKIVRFLPYKNLEKPFVTVLYHYYYLDFIYLWGIV